ncbi:hypothetical protein GCM10009641_30950 [Mycobacterium cookii]|uniref:Uncharacterized protein n=1 Tax=Nocardioides furvisabuli TaxID=375542 RepID=A0ABN2XKX0_9ACTN
MAPDSVGMGHTDPVEPGQLCSVVATFIEDRDGRALVRLPNGSKTSVPYGAVRADAARGHFVPAQDGAAVDVFCGDDDWSASASDFNEAAAMLTQHTSTH